MEPAVEIEVTLPLADIDVSVLEDAESDRGIGGAAPAIVDGAAEFQRLGVARSQAKASGALYAAGRSEAVEAKARKVRRGIEHHVERIGSCAGDEFAAAGPVEEGRRAAANVKGPGAGNRDDGVEDKEHEHDKLYEICETAAEAIRHAGSIAGEAKFERKKNKIATKIRDWDG